MSNAEELKSAAQILIEDENDEKQVRQALETVVTLSHRIANDAGWWLDLETGEDVRTWPEKYFSVWVLAKIALIHSELSEGVEGHRKNLMDDKLPHRRMLEVELADSVIRTFDLAGGLKLDLGGAIVEKMIYNASRADHKPENRLSDNGKRI